eukprot:139360_1
MTGDSVKLSHECRDCSMRFDSAEHMANHINKFCKDSAFGDPEVFLRQLRAADGVDNAGVHQGALTFAEIRSYVETQEDGNVGQMTLDDIRKQFQSDELESELEKLKAEVLQKREAEMVEELRQLKLRQKMLSLERDKEQEKVEKKLG